MKFYTFFLTVTVILICLACIQSPPENTDSDMVDRTVLPPLEDEKGDLAESGTPEIKPESEEKPVFVNPETNNKPENNITVKPENSNNVGNSKPKPVAEKPVETKVPSSNPEFDPGSGKGTSVAGESVQKPSPLADSPPHSAPYPDHSQWDGLLRKYVSSSGKVDYNGMKSEVSTLDAYLKILKDNPPNPTWPRAERMAFWINAYNAYTVKMIIKNYPVSSITKLHDGEPWKVRWVEVGDKTYTLDEVENAVIRPRFNDPRIHFAVNCAAKSCPPLLNKAWTASNLESNLEKQTRTFINNSQFNQITETSVRLSRIFDWYKSDFGNIIIYLNKYSNTQISPTAKINFIEYDWSLND